MLGRVTVPILPHVRVTGAAPVRRDGVLTRAQEFIGAVSGAIVTIYNAQGDGTAAVSEAGVAASTATKAFVYRDRAGAVILDNPITLDDFGGPDDTARSADAGVALSFFGFPGTYHLLVTMPNGQKFGIPHVHVPMASTMHLVDLASRYNDTIANVAASATDKAGPTINTLWGTDMTQDNTNSGQWGAISTSGAAQTAIWQGETMRSAGDQSDPALGLDGVGIYGRPMILAGSLIYDAAVSGASATMLLGIAMGYNSAAANAAPIQASPSQPLIALYAQMDTLGWYLLVAKGNSTAYEKLLLTGVTAMNPGNNLANRLEIRYNGAGKVCEGWVDGWFGGRITTAAVFPTPTFVTGKKYGYNLFSTSGSDAAGVIQCILHAPKYWFGRP